MSMTYKYFPEVKYFSGVWDLDSEKYFLWKPDSDLVQMRMMLMNIGIGFKDEKGMDIFTFYIVPSNDFDPKDLKTKKTPIWLVQGDFSWENIHNEIKLFVESCKGESIEDSFKKIRKKMNWEYEGYNNVSLVEKEWLVRMPFYYGDPDGGGLSKEIK